MSKTKNLSMCVFFFFVGAFHALETFLYGIAQTHLFQKHPASNSADVTANGNSDQSGLTMV